MGWYWSGQWSSFGFLNVPFTPSYLKSTENLEQIHLFEKPDSTNPLNQVPWATAYSTWYHQFIDFPVQTPTAAILLQEYTITDRGSILSLDAETANCTVIYKAGADDAEDPLLNPAHLLVSARAPNPDRAIAFAE